jgi:acetyl-CoA carboxylase alpha subunit
MEEVKRTILRELDAFEGRDTAELVRERRKKFRQMGWLPGRFPAV